MKQLAALQSPDVMLVADQLALEARVLPFSAGTVAIFSLRSPGKTEPSEDCAALIPYGEDAGLLVVADGVGGLPAGEQAASVVIARLQEALAAAWVEGRQLRAAVLDGIEEANRAVLQLGLGAATTLAVVEIQGRRVRPYHVGDSMALVVGQRRKLKLQTISHSPVGYAVEAGFLDQIEAMYHEERHLVSNILGSADMHMTIGSSLELAARDTVLVASDGLFDNLHLEEITQTIRKGPLSQVAEELGRLSLNRMLNPEPGQPSKPDDLTAIIYRPAQN